MKNLLILVFAATLFMACNTKQRYTQNSPEIEIYKKSMKAYENKNWDEYKSYYADTAKIVNNNILKNAISIDKKNVLPAFKK